MSSKTNKTVVVAISDNGGYFLPALTALVPGFTMDSEKERVTYMLHKAPVAALTPEIRTNFDIVIDVNPRELNHANMSTATNAHYSGLGQQYVGVPRFAKSVQQHLVKKFTTYRPETSSFLYQPETYADYDGFFAGQKQGQHSPDYYVLKPEFGARGNQQAVCPKHLVKAFLNDSSIMGAAALKKAYPMVCFTGHVTVEETANLLDSGDKKEPDRYFFSNGGPIIQELLSIKEEYRLIFNQETIYYYKRNRQTAATNGNGETYLQGNLDKDDKSKISLWRMEEEDVYFIDTEIQILRALLHDIGTPIGSLDLARLSDGRLSVLEFSNEFEYRNIDPVVIADLYKNFIRLSYDYSGLGAIVTL